MPAAGERLGPYALVRPLASGGMGEVWVAAAPDGSEVALKLLPEGSLGDDVARARFLREAELARSVDHPRVQRVLDADPDADRPWLATELVVGPTLAQRVEDGGPVPGPELQALAVGLAEALEAVHAAGLVHRDLSPANVVLGGDGPVLVDFGIARAPIATTLTEAGTVVGTAGWLAPEALRDEELTDAADVWSWGLVLAFAATGRPPAAADRVEAVLRRVLDGDLDLRGLPPWLDRLVRRAVEPTPARRPTAGELLDRLRAGAADLGTVPLGATVVAPVPASGPRATEPLPPPRTPRRWVPVLVRAGVLAAGGLVGLLAPPLTVVLVVAVAVLAAIGVNLWREERATEIHPVIGAWTVAGFGVMAALVALAQAIGLVLAVIVLVAVLLVFIVLGGDFG